jgi:sugar-phosphatase
VVEDAPNGIAAARAAGVGTVIGVGERAGGGDVDIRVRDLRSVAWDGVRLVVRAAP